MWVDHDAIVPDISSPISPTQKGNYGAFEATRNYRFLLVNRVGDAICLKLALIKVFFFKLALRCHCLCIAFWEEKKVGNLDGIFL